MRTLEERIRPPFLARAWPRDLLGVALLVGLVVVLAPAMRVDWAALGGTMEGPEGPLDAEPGEGIHGPYIPNDDSAATMLGPRQWSWQSAW